MLRIADARNARGWSQEQLAAAIGTTQQTVQRWETGQTDPQVSKVEAISAALGVTMSYLLGVDAQTGTVSTLTDEEQQLVDLYRMSNPQGREAIMAVARASSGVERQPSAADMSA